MDCPILYDVLYNANIIILMGMTIFCFRLGHLRAWISAAPTELNLLLSVFPQGFISGFALISPWALQECRPFRALCQIVCCFPRVSYRALPSFHPGLCRSTALSGLFVGLFAVSPGFHIGLCPYFTLGFAGVSPFQGSLSDWLVCFWVCKWIVAFVFCIWLWLYCVCGIDWCDWTMSPKGAILLHSPGRKPWVNH